MKCAGGVQLILASCRVRYVSSMCIPAATVLVFNLWLKVLLMIAT
jgi:hypothetical protein